MRSPAGLRRRGAARSAARMSAGPADQLAVTLSSRRNTAPPSIAERRAGRRRRVDAQPAARAERLGGGRRWRRGAVRRDGDVTSRDVDRARCRARSRPGLGRGRAGSGRARAPTPRRRRGACAAAMCSRPLQPAPTTSRRSPGRDARRGPAPRSAHRAARSGSPSPGRGPPSGSSSPTSSGLDAHVLREAARVEARRRGTARTASRGRARQRRHSPHGAWWWIATRSPGRRRRRRRRPRRPRRPARARARPGACARRTSLDVGAAGRAREHAADDLARPADGVRPLFDPSVVDRDGERDLHATAASGRRHRPRASRARSPAPTPARRA